MNKSITEQLTYRIINELLYEAGPPKDGDGGFGGLFGQEMYDPENLNGSWGWDPMDEEYRWYDRDGNPLKEPPQGAPDPPKNPPGANPNRKRPRGLGRSTGQQEYIDNIINNNQGGRPPRGVVPIKGLGILGLLASGAGYWLSDPGPGPRAPLEGRPIIAPPEQGAPQPTRYPRGQR